MSVEPMSRPAEARTCSTATGVGHVLPGRGGPAAAGLGLRDDADRLVAKAFGGFALDNKRAVEVLAALGGQIEPALGQQGSDGLVHGLGGLGRAALAMFAPIISLDEQPTTTSAPRASFALSSSSAMASRAARLISS